MFLIKKITNFILIMFITISISFIMIHNLPKNIIDSDDENYEVIKSQIIKEYNLDKPLSIQYTLYMKNILSGNLGLSMRYPDKKVVDVIKENFPLSIELSFYVLSFSFSFGIPLGIYSVINKKLEVFLLFLSKILISIPTFIIIGALQYYIVSIHNKIGLAKIPITGFDSFPQKLFPTISLSLFYISVIIRLLNVKIKEEMKKEYVKYLLSKGFSEIYIIKNHILKNILTVLISTFTPYMISLITGSFVVENLFGLKGLGRYFSYSILDRDYFMILGLTIFYTFILLTTFTIMEIILEILDKRMKVK